MQPLQNLITTIKSNRKLVFLILFIFLFRLFFGLNYDFWFEDNLQVFLIGLKYYCTGVWPYWGPDLIHTQSAIPGALQGLVVGIPFQLIRIPEAAHIFLNILSIGALLFFSWYLNKRIPAIGFNIIFIWVALLPAAMYYTTNVQNPSYVFAGAILFFIAAIELANIYPQRVLNDKLCLFLLGFSFFWIFQFHLSWIILLPYIGYLGYANILRLYKNRTLGKSIILFAVGLCITALPLWPTLSKYGWQSIEALSSNSAFNFANIVRLPDIVFKFISFATFEAETFLSIGDFSIKNAWAYLGKYYFIIPFVVLFFALRLWQTAYLILAFFKTPVSPIHKKIKLFTLVTLGILMLSFLFTDHFPNAHKYYLLMPVSVWYSMHIFEPIIIKYKSRLLFKLIPVLGLAFYAIIALINIQTGQSLYNHRNLVSTALQQKDHTIIGVRREMQIIKNRYPAFWIQKNNDTNTLFTCDFEFGDPSEAPDNFSRKMAQNGQWSVKISKQMPYAPSLKLKMKELALCTEVEFSGFFFAEGTTGAIAVLAISDSAQKISDWQGVKLDNGPKKNIKGWQPFHTRFIIPLAFRQLPNADITLYLHNDGVPVYADNLSILFLRK